MINVVIILLVASVIASSNDFLCKNGKTPWWYQRCDGVRDCADGSDEDDCGVPLYNVPLYNVPLYNIAATTESLIDKQCENNFFHCANDSCIPSEMQCNGREDCENGRDEENCDFSSLSAQYLNDSKIKAIQWMKSQRNEKWSWEGNTHRAAAALYIAGGSNFNGSNKDDEIIAKQLELEVATHLLRREHDKISSSDLASYINALLVICHDPRNFYDYDLISYLKEDLERKSSLAPPFLYLTLCNAKEPISEDIVDQLLTVLKTDSPNHGFVSELQALATMALSCIVTNGNSTQHLQQNITEALNNLKRQQLDDGSFGNIYTTALILQAFIANSQVKGDSWNVKSSINFLTRAQKLDGSFGNFLTTYLIMPVLNGKSLLDIGNKNCSFKRSRNGISISDVESRLEKKITLTYSLFVGDKKDHRYSLTFKTPENSTVLKIMTLAADISPKYEYKIHEVKKKKYIYEISNIPNDPEHNKFWFICQVSVSNDTVPFFEQSPDKLIVHDHDDIVMWYKTLDSLY